MIIMEVIPSFDPLGGAENFVFNLSIDLQKAAKVYVVSLYHRENAYVADELEKRGIEIIYLNKCEGLDIGCTRRFNRVLKSIKPDIVHLHLISYLVCLPAMLSKTSRFIYTFHTMISNETYGGTNNPRNILIKFLMKCGFMFPVTISNIVDESFENFFGVCDRKIIYNGINISKYVYNKQNKKKYTFITVGSFNDIKNNLFMIKCVERLIKEGRNINYIVLGTGKNFELCKRYCIQNSLDDRIQLIGAVNNVEDYLAASSCLLLASHWEGNPLVINEAIAAGVWVVANSVGGVVDLIDDTNGYLAIPENEENFVDNMNKFLDSQGTIIEHIIPENIERNRRKVDLANTSSEYLELMQKLMKRG